jgi:opacity protein-like surface antigen
MRFIFISSISTLLLISTSAQAETANWDGFYAGPFVGYVDGKLATNPDHASTTGNYDDNGVMAGIVGGYRKQMDNNIVIGGELIVPLYMEKGTAVDLVFFPGQIIYEAKPKLGVLASVQVGYATGKALPYVFGAVGFARVEGRTLNVDLQENLSPGFVQKDSATPVVWQLGAGLDVQASESLVIGGRIAFFKVERADYTMPWNSPGPNKFGMSSALGQVSVTYRFGH